MEADPLTLVQDCIEALHGAENYTQHFHTLLRPIRASLTPTPKTTIRLTVTQSLCNTLGNFHGGAIATVFDECSTTPIALVRKEGFWLMYGVSRTLNVAYLDAATEGDEVEVECELVKIGKKLGGSAVPCCSLRLLTWTDDSPHQGNDEASS